MQQLKLKPATEAPAERPTAPTEPALEVTGVTKRFRDVDAVSDLTMDVRAGEVFGFVGSNGAGKTTTLRIILGVLAADRGEVRWRGAPITFDDRRRIGYMPEERGLFPKMQVGEQLRYLAQLHGSSAADAAADVGRWLERFGLAARERDELQKLSHGNQQRVQLAAALVFRPTLLVLDEPFAGLDPEAVDSMAEVLHEQAAAGIPVIFSSHQLDVVERLSQRVGIIRKGRLVAHGTVDELRSGGPRRYRVEVGGDDGWPAALDGVRVVERDGRGVVVELNDAIDDQAVLHAALAAGPVREFARVQPTLLDIFRGAMSEGADDV